MTTLAAAEAPLAPVVPLHRGWIPARCHDGDRWLVHYTRDDVTAICGRRVRHIEQAGAVPTCPACFAAAQRSIGLIYLLHFDEPFGHARHYCGWTQDLRWRLRCHTGSTGSNLMKHVNAAHIGWQLAGVWPGSRSDERTRHNRGSAVKWCPTCLGRPLGEAYRVRVHPTALDDGTPYGVREITGSLA